ncbi:hypothetical protein COW36_20825 [bacterium (Candidatus Blackallbacteria) CG17_big_fil_post_rev_8_21_14_2_50_48_46]|uniref:DUF2939 domain-containing protein n=1 Tax=bacterium (Candidatus Blackallbacteria) CG17_big_fil_post_rev_8_21_14_2_50_48_46 TaxID=2014261 RepID=A0A2M7FYQ8_9BACT|nr:MAG: hypothetical protein COW64_14135 [bacterium (Candidatus Blackallbacteria) CG18_big_fil_WC_8_21_14_2_50_49_26]PIW14487.1 MAG: hypothetical protein COW36_20825 [bacterium (Candidatus Blackallbacteria) CG17_big_fil_post_rev_8_21_14_2_50_48_46]PIW47173.1 MAG: hypothetical protein COW20_13270 [bacterium (Candidatus Blackallbacteria) CG13_big_fil_rev_8_21_14_2_50_49_14]
MKRAFNLRVFSLLLAIFCLLAPSVMAKPALTPAEAPVRFFKALEAMDFAEAWQSLTLQSQQEIIEKIIATEKNPKLTPVLVRQLFDSNDKTLQLGFWASFRHHIGFNDWLKQKFELEKTISGTEARIKTLPAKISLVVRNESGEWKFGFTETFMPTTSPSASPSAQP